MEVGCYSIDLYCDTVTDVPPSSFLKVGYCDDGIHIFDEFPHQYIGETRGECRKQARQRGWLFKRDGRTICPKCSGKI